MRVGSSFTFVLEGPGEIAYLGDIVYGQVLL